jgi:cytochrome c556
MQLLGFAPADYVENLKINSNERRKQNAVNDKRKKLMRLHNMAKTEGDTAAVRAALEKIKQYNNSLPENFQKDGNIDGEDLRKSLTGFITTTGKMVNGIVYTDAMRKSVEDYE